MDESKRSKCREPSIEAVQVVARCRRTMVIEDVRKYIARQRAY